jgi:HflK protein
MRYGFGPLMDDLRPLLILAFLGSGFIAVIVPESFFENPVTQGWSGMLVMLVVGIPIYVCATSSTPLVAALLLKGLSPGAALVFLLAGPVTNLGTILAVLRYMGKRVMVIYVVCTAGITLLLGGIIESIYQDLGIPVTAIVGKTTELLPDSVKVISLAILLILMGASAIRTNLAQRWAEKARAWCKPLGFDPLGKLGISLIVLILLGFYLSTGVTAVDTGEKGWLFTFGKVERTATGEVVTYEPGLVVHWPYPFQTVRTGRPDEVRSLASGFRHEEGGDAYPLAIADGGALEELDMGSEAQVMDGQESLVSLKFSVQYRLTDPYAYSMEFDEPEDLIESYAAAAVRTVCAQRSTQDILVGHRRELETLSRAALQNELDELAAGVEVLRINFIDVHAPAEVHFAFRDVASAAEDKHKQELEGESAFRRTLAEARARAYRVEQEAEIYRYMIESAAQGNSFAFSERAEAYHKTREITRLRMFLDTMKSVLSATPMVMPLKEGIDVELWLRGSDGAEPPFMEEGKPASKEAQAAEKKTDRPSWFDALKR